MSGSNRPNEYLETAHVLSEEIVKKEREIPQDRADISQSDLSFLSEKRRARAQAYFSQMKIWFEDGYYHRVIEYKSKVVHDIGAIYRIHCTDTDSAISNQAEQLAIQAKKELELPDLKSIDSADIAHMANMAMNWVQDSVRIPVIRPAENPLLIRINKLIQHHIKKAKPEAILEILTHELSDGNNESEATSTLRKQLLRKVQLLLLDNRTGRKVVTKEEILDLLDKTPEKINRLQLAAQTQLAAGETTYNRGKCQPTEYQKAFDYSSDALNSLIEMQELAVFLGRSKVDTYKTLSNQVLRFRAEVGVRLLQHWTDKKEYSKVTNLAGTILNDMQCITPDYQAKEDEKIRKQVVDLQRAAEKAKPQEKAAAAAASPPSRLRFVGAPPVPAPREEEPAAEAKHAAAGSYQRLS